ncbi:hypothetical protein [Bacillus cereus group sp. Bce040]|uniref:hypothetical protein n=1 Tax=Bacillus cereus group sp. Bce040 TaxID=3445229 RepID=UPI003F287C84
MQIKWLHNNTDSKMLSASENLILELSSEYKKCLQDDKPEEAGEILQLLIIVISDYGIEYPRLKILESFETRVKFNYVKERIKEIQDVWKTSII